MAERAAIALLAALLLASACRGGDPPTPAPVRVDKAMARVSVSVRLAAASGADEVVEVLRRRFEALDALEAAPLVSLEVRREGEAVLVEAVLDGGASCAAARTDALAELVRAQATRSGRLAFHLVAAEPRRGALLEALKALPGIEGLRPSEYVRAAAVDVAKPAPDVLGPRLAELAVPTGYRAIMQRQHELRDGLRTGQVGARVWLVTAKPDLGGRSVAEAGVRHDEQTGEAQVDLRFTPEGGAHFADLTGMAVERYLAIVFEGEAQSVPVVKERIAGGRAVITLGRHDGGPAAQLQQAREIAAVLRAGPLEAEVRLLDVQRQCVGP